MLRKMTLLWMLASTVRAEHPAVVNFTTCSLEQEQLGLCQKLVTDLKSENELLGQKINILTKQRDAAEAEAVKASNPLLPTWTWVIIGAAIGGATVLVIKH